MARGIHRSESLTQIVDDTGTVLTLGGGGGGGGAPTDASYLTLGAHPDLTDEVIYGNLIRRGLDADKGAAGIAGRLYFATDGVQVGYFDTGAAWFEVARAGDMLTQAEADTLYHSIGTDFLTEAEGDARYWQLTTDLATQAELNAHDADTTSVHGIADTSALLRTPLTVNVDADTHTIHDLGAISIGTNGLSGGTQLMELGGSGTFISGEHVVLVEFGEYEAAFNTTAGGSFIGVHITPTVVGNASVTEIVGIQSQVSSITDVTSQIHAVEALVNFGTIGKTAAVSRALWAQTNAALGTITEAMGVDSTGGSGIGTITTMYGVRVGRTSGALSLKGTTIYGVYVGQGSVRNYFGGDTRFGGGTNDEWTEFIAEFDANGLDLVGFESITGSTPGLVIGATTRSAADIAIELARTETGLSNVGRTGININESFTWTTGGGSTVYTALNAVGTFSIAVGQTISAITAVLAQPTTGGSGTTTALTALKANAQGGGAVTTAIAVDAKVNQLLGTATTAVGVDIGMPSQALGTITTGIGLRITNMVEPTTIWGIQVGAYNSFHEGSLRIGAISAGSTATPNARLEVVHETLGSDVHRLVSVATNDDVTERVVMGRVATTDATVTTIITVAIPASTTMAIEVKVWSRRTGGGGSAEDGSFFTRYWAIKNVGGTATIIGAVGTPVTIESVAGYDVTGSASGANWLIRVTGIAATNITWHALARLYPVGS